MVHIPTCNTCVVIYCSTYVEHCIIYVLATLRLDLLSHTCNYTCNTYVGYTPVFHIQFYTCNKVVGYTQKLHV